MATDKKLEQVEKLTKEIESETDFEKVIEKFSAAADILKQVLSEGKEQKGRVMEIVKELDGLVEKELDEDEGAGKR